jgi:ABC-type multidrug transport system fused ATPase/permease subunit
MQTSAWSGSRSSRSSASTRGLVGDLARPYRGWLVIILLAMLVETATSLAGPWPLKIVIDNAVGRHAAPEWVVRLLGPALVASGPALAAAAALGMVLLAALGGIASYIDSYYTESVGQWVANDLRMRVYAHLERLSFNYYDTHQTSYTPPAAEAVCPAV